MIRNAFNGGELSPQVQMRADLDVFARGCSCIENFDVGQAGGVSRRRGFRRFAVAQGASSRLFTYAYSNSVRYLVEMGEDAVRVFDTNGIMVWETESPYTAECILDLRTLQVNSLLLVTCRYCPPMQLVCDADGGWSFSLYTYKVPPWRYSSYRDYPVVVNLRSDGYYQVGFDAQENEYEASPEIGEVVRVSYYTDAQEIKASQSKMFTSVTRTESEGFLMPGNSGAEVKVTRGTVVAVRRAPESAIYTVSKEWKGDTHFVKGLIDPANYTDYFQVSTDTDQYDKTISELSESQSYTKGQLVRFESGYWDLFTCIADYSSATHFFADGINPEDYPGHFVRGVFLGAAPCKGTWKFYCNGTWYGSYEVRACFEGAGTQYDDWEHRAEIWSHNAAPSNAPTGGDESGEECYISLWLTRARAYGDSWNVRNFPADGCGNVLVVSSYKHDLVLKYQAVVDEDTEEVLDAYYVLMDKVRTSWYGAIKSRDWSWCAFSAKYGFPRLACIYNQRLVFAGTDSQPQTIWMSQVDDIDNFDIVERENGGLALTMSSQSQDPIRWMKAQNSKIMLGTAEGEYVIQSDTGNVLSYSNAVIVNHGFVGAADVDALQCSDKLIYFERGGGRVMQHGFDYAQDAYISGDLTVFAEHILTNGGGVKEGVFMRKPDAKAILVLHDGTIALMTYNSMHQVNAWHRYTTRGRFLSVAMMPNGDAADSLYALVERTEVVPVPEGGLVDPGNTHQVYYIEVMDKRSTFVDNGDNDYVSTLLTNALTTTRLGSNKQHPSTIMVYLPVATQAKGIEVTADDGKHWANPPMGPLSYLQKGWNPIPGFGELSWDKAVGIRVRGNKDLQILALQA